MKKQYKVKFVGLKGADNLPEDQRQFSTAEEMKISEFRPEGSCHKPETTLRLLHDTSFLYGLFQVRDRYVRSVHTQYNDPVWKDSCVEFFVQPEGEGGYFNFEFNCGGAILASYITDHERCEGGFRSFVMIDERDLASIRINSTMPKVVDPEIDKPVLWKLGFAIPFKIFEKYRGNVSANSEVKWRGNAYKCADDSTHPHWASWSPVSDLNFHLPECFGELIFEESN